MPMLARPPEVSALSADTSSFLSRMDSPEWSPNGGLPASLEALETTPTLQTAETGFDGRLPHPLESQSRFQRIAHAQYHNARWTVINAMWQPEAAAAVAKRARRMGMCCQGPTLRASSNGQVCTSLARCRDRLCPLCGERRGRQASVRTHAIVQRFNSPRFLTLTLRHRGEPLREMLDRLHVCIAKLRRETRWKESVLGGVFGFEVTRNTKAGEWHAHAHIIVEGSYFPHPVLKALWLKITGDSHIVDVRAVADRKKAAAYISRYVAKPVDVTSWCGAEIREYAAAMHGRRLLQTFGIAHNAKLDDDAFDERPTGSTHLCTAFGLARAVAAGVPKALRAKSLLTKMGRDFATIAGEPWDRGQTVVLPEGDDLAELLATLEGMDEYLLPPNKGRASGALLAETLLLREPDPDLPWPI
jgi:hypothetical protein